MSDSEQYHIKEAAEKLLSTSPTVYILYDLITAAAINFGGEPFVVTVGPSLSLYTQAFAPDVPRTARCPSPVFVTIDNYVFVEWVYEWETIDYRDFNSLVPWSTVSKQYDCRSNGAETYHNPSAFDPGFTVHPPVEYPRNITNFFPEWKTCTWGAWLAFDPPYALSKATMPP